MLLPTWMVRYWKTVLSPTSDRVSRVLFLTWTYLWTVVVLLVPALATISVVTRLWTAVAHWYWLITFRWMPTSWIQKTLSLSLYWRMLLLQPSMVHVQHTVLFWLLPRRVARATNQPSLSTLQATGRALPSHTTTLIPCSTSRWWMRLTRMTVVLADTSRIRFINIQRNTSTEPVRILYSSTRHTTRLSMATAAIPTGGMSFTRHHSLRFTMPASAAVTTVLPTMHLSVWTTRRVSWPLVTISTRSTTLT